MTHLRVTKFLDVGYRIDTACGKQDMLAEKVSYIWNAIDCKNCMSFDKYKMARMDAMRELRK